MKLNNRKHQVLLTAKKLFIEKGFDATSIQDILTESDISKGTFYNYFSSKNECLIAILNSGRKETEIRRQELQIGEDKTDASLLAKQISIRFQVNHEHNLLPIFEAIFYSGDAELRGFAEKHHLAELNWLSDRLIDVYGKEAAPHAVDCAIMFIGMLQHMIHVWLKKNPYEQISNTIISFVVGQIDSLMPEMIAQKKHFFDHHIFEKTIGSQPTKQQILEDLKSFNGKYEDLSENKRQYLQFLMDELEEEKPRIHLIESIVKSFRSDFINTSKEKDVQDLVGHILFYLETLMD